MSENAAKVKNKNVESLENYSSRLIQKNTQVK